MIDNKRLGESPFQNLPELILAQTLTKSYKISGAAPLEILRGLHLEVRKGEAVAIVGASGAGKSTLLHILGTLDRPTLGKVFYKGKDLMRMDDITLSNFRNRTMGFVFQFHHLLGEFTALENVMFPCRIGGLSMKEARVRAENDLKLLGLENRRHHYPSELSGGEQQRVAIARALVQRPEVLFADEPTGNLDKTNAMLIQDLFFELQQKLQLTLIVVTHDLKFAQKFPRVLSMQDGQWARGEVLTS